MDLLKPEYKRTHYSWMSDGVLYSRKIDGVDTRSMIITPNKKYLMVMQSSAKYGPDNLLILQPDGTEYRRLKNPYSSSPKFQPDDKYEFNDVSDWSDKVLAKVAVTRDLPGRPYKAEPTYVTFYDCDTWESSPLNL